MKITIIADDGELLEQLYAPDDVVDNTWQRICHVLEYSSNIEVYEDEQAYESTKSIMATEYNSVT